MGSPTSSMFSEIFLQHIESTVIFEILVQNHIVGYFRYVDDNLIIYNDSITNIHDAFNAFNNLTPNIKFTMEEETNNGINFLDVTIRKKTIHSHLMFIENRPQLTQLFLETHAIHRNIKTQPFDI